MICKQCGCKRECEYYEANIEPVLNTEQTKFSDDVYLRRLGEALEDFDCDYFERDDK